MAHYLMIRNYVSRNQAAVVPDNEFIIRILVLFGSITMYVLQELSQISVSYARLRALNQYWNKMRDKDGSIKIKCTRHILNFGLALEQRNKFLESLEKWEDDLTTQYPEHPL
jgi:hypothetical protein